jgi:hypothetical protein
VAGPDQAVFHVALAYPADWADRAAAARAESVDAASNQIGQRVAYLILTWHELATWFGYRTFFFDESRSAFTYDDSIAHLVGMRVAERAMADRDRPFDDAVTHALVEELHRLGAVTPAQTEQAVRAVEGAWWSGDAPLKRQADVCPGNEVEVHAWLVPGLAFATAAADAPPEPFPLPRVDGRGGDPAAPAAASIEIETRMAEAATMRALLPDRPERFRDDRDMPALLRAMRAQMRERFGPDVDRPWPTPAAVVRSPAPLP